MARQISKDTQHSADITLVHDSSETDSHDGWHLPSRLWIPSSHSKRTLVLCFDGTGDEFDSDVSNHR